MQTVLGVFDDRTSAQRAVERLTESGFDRDDVHLEAAESSDAMGSDRTTDTSSGSGGTAHFADGDGGGVMSSIGHFFSNLFGGDDDNHPHRAHAERYSEAVRRGSHVVVVDARDEADADRAADLLQELGAVDVDERAEQWRSSGWTGGSYNDSATPYSGQQMMAGGSSVHPNVARLEQPPVGTPGSLLDSDRPALGSDPYMDSGSNVKLHDTDGARGTSAGTAGTGGIGALGALGGGSDTTGRRDHDATLQDQRTLDVVQEELQVGKRTRERGGVRVVQRVSERPVREIVRLREERAVVERRNVDRDATSADLGSDRGDVVVEVRETVEEPVVAKRAHVVEEVVVGKEVREREETIEETLRRKDVDVEKLAGSDVTTRNLEHADARRSDSGLTGGSRSDNDLGTLREPKDLSDRRQP